MNISQLPYFVAIAQCRNLSAAACQLNISQPALSKYVASLEKSVGLSLFYRKNKEMFLTDAGRTYLQSAQKILEIKRNTDVSIQNLYSKKSKILRIGGTPQEGVQSISKIYPILLNRFPECQIDIKEGYTFDLYKYVASGVVDFALTTSLQTNLQVNFIPLFRQELYLCAPNFYRQYASIPKSMAELPEICLQELRDLPFILAGKRTSIGSASRALFETENIKPLVLYESDNSYMVNQIIHAGMGCGFAPANLVSLEDNLAYFRLSSSPYIEYGLLKKANTPLTIEERYLVYSLLKREEWNLNVHFCWSDILYQIIDEFDAPSLWGRDGI